LVTTPGYIQATDLDKKLVELNWDDYRILWPSEYMDIAKPTVTQMIDCIGKIRSEIRDRCCKDYNLKVEHVIRDFAKQHWPESIDAVRQRDIMLYGDVRKCFLMMGPPRDTRNPDGRYYLAYQLLHGLYAPEKYYSPEKYSERWLKEKFNCVLDRDHSGLRNSNLRTVCPEKSRGGHTRDPLSQYLLDRRISKLNKQLVKAIEKGSGLSLIKTKPKSGKKHIVFQSEGGTFYGQFYLCCKMIENNSQEGSGDMSMAEESATSGERGKEEEIRRLEQAISSVNASPTAMATVFQNGLKQLARAKNKPPMVDLTLEELREGKTPRSQGEMSNITFEVSRYCCHEQVQETLQLLLTYAQTTTP
jgi:hypothetical protein